MINLVLIYINLKNIQKFVEILSLKNIQFNITKILHSSQK